MLLEALRDPENASIWREFDGRYRPVLVAFGHKLGLGEEDAHEVAQATLAAFVEAFRDGKYERDRGRLRSWLFTIARARVAGIRRRDHLDGGRRGESALADVADEGRLSAMWDAQWREALIREGLRQLRAGGMEPKTLAAFEQVTLEEREPAEVAQSLGLSIDSVYVAKSRALRRLHEIITRLEKDW